MSPMLHIFRKDVRRLRWGIVAWLVVVVARLLADTIGADVALGGFAMELGIRQVTGLLALVQGILLAILVSLLIHDEPLVGREAFWITRPIPASALLSAKVVLAAVLFLCILFIANIWTASAFDIRGSELARLMPVVLVNQLMLLSILMTVAVLTPSLTRYAIALVAMVSAFALIIGAQLLLILMLATEVDSGSDERLFDPTRSIMGAFAIIATGILVVVYQYRRRRLKPAVALAAAGVFLSYVVLSWWPWSYADLQTREMAAPPGDTRAVGVALDASERRVTDTFAIRRGAPRKKDVAVRTTVSGVPPEFRARALVAGSRLELPGGVVVQTGNEPGRTVSGMVIGSARGDAASVEAALGGVRLVTRPNMPVDFQNEWTRLLRVEEETFAAHRDETGRLTANIDVAFERPVVRATMPLADSVRGSLDGTHFAIVRVFRRATGCTVLLRRSFVEALFSAPSYRHFMFVLRNRTRGEAALSEQQGMMEPYTGGLLGISAPHVGGRGFVLEQHELDFPSRSWTSAVDLDDAWVSGAEFVILEIVPAGRITRTVTVDGFRMMP